MAEVNIGYTEDEAVKTLSNAETAQDDSGKKMKEIMEKISDAFGEKGMAVGGEMGKFMNNSVQNDLSPIFQRLTQRLDTAIQDIDSTNQDMRNFQQDTDAMYKQGLGE